MWWLNTDVDNFKAKEISKNYSPNYAKQLERFLGQGAPATSFAATGGGGHVVWIDHEHDLVVVTRWLKKNETSSLKKW